jgi:uncharacterized RDD family membrane protein YckC
VRQDGGMTSPTQAAWPQEYPPPGYAPPPVQLGGHPLASPGERLGAKVLDHLVLLIPSLLVGAVFFVPTAAVLSAGGGSIAPATAFVLLALAVSLWALVHAAIYYAYQVSYQQRAGQTVGKRALGLRIVRLDGGVPDRRAYRRRFLVENASWLVLVVPVLGFVISSVAGIVQWLDALWCLWDKPFQQCLHDKYAGTAVVKVPGA